MAAVLRGSWKLSESARIQLARFADRLSRGLFARR